MAGSFEKLVKSQDIFISSQQSGETGASAKQEFNSFKVCFNQHPLTCSANQFVRLSLTQFWSYRNWYYVNKTNNLFDENKFPIIHIDNFGKFIPNKRKINHANYCIKKKQDESNT